MVATVSSLQVADPPLPMEAGSEQMWGRNWVSRPSNMASYIIEKLLRNLHRQPHCRVLKHCKEPSGEYICARRLLLERRLCPEIDQLGMASTLLPFQVLGFLA